MKFCFALQVFLIICGFVVTIRGFGIPNLFDDLKKNYDNDEAVKFMGADVEIEINETTSDFSPYNDIHFQLYTPDNPKDPQIIQIGNESSLLESNYNNSRPTRIVIHGWRPNVGFIPMFIEAYFEKGNHDVNLIIVNWLKGAETILYNVARGRVRMVAHRVIKFVNLLVETGGMEYSDLNVIGHSIGAHVAGIVGKYVKEGLNVRQGNISKIIGLDPALPFFSLSDTRNRLAHTDADYVEVIHTSSGRLSFSQPIGTIDFYVNGGQSQPGCGIDPTATCSHRRSWQLYVESIYNPEFAAFGCDSFHNLKNGLCKDDNSTEDLAMGGEPGNDLTAKGIFFLHTNGKPPYALGQEGMARASTPAVEKTGFWNDLFSFNKKNEKSDVAQFFDNQIGQLVSWKNKLVNKFRK